MPLKHLVKSNDYTVQQYLDFSLGPRVQALSVRFQLTRGQGDAAHKKVGSAVPTLRPQYYQSRLLSAKKIGEP